MLFSFFFFFSVFTSCSDLQLFRVQCVFWILGDFPRRDEWPFRARMSMLVGLTAEQNACVPFVYFCFRHFQFNDGVTICIYICLFSSCVYLVNMSKHV